MNFNEIKKKFIEIYESVMEENFNEDASMLTSTEWDSLKQIILIAAIEDKIDLDIEYEDILEMTSVKKILEIFKKNVRNKMYKDINNIYDLFVKKTNENPDKEFIISLFKANEEIVSYNEFFKRTNFVREYFQEIGLNKGDRINIIIQNSAEFLILYMAALSIGIIVCPINYSLTPIEMYYIINDSGSKAVICEYEYYLLLKQSGYLKNFTNYMVISKNENENLKNNFLKVIKSNNPTKILNHAKVKLNDEAVIIYTSGTSGKPKGVVLTHKNLITDSEALVKWFGLNSDSRALCILPLFHNNGQVVTFLAPLLSGGSSVMVKGNISLMVFWEIVKKYSVSYSSVIPTMLSVLLSYNRKRKDDTMQFIICGGALLPQRVQKEFEKKYHVPIIEGYGLTETTSFSSFNPRNIEERKEGSIGKELPINEMMIVDEYMSKLPDGEIGEIIIKGSNIFKKYNKLPVQTKQAFTGKWFRSGDYGYKDKDGFFYFKNRKDYLIIKGGENIYPREIENVIYNHPEVKECAVIGIPHKIWGEDIALFIERNNDSLTKKMILSFINNKIAKYKIPSKIFFFDELEGMKVIPKGPTNKILRKIIISYYNEKISKKEKANE